MLVGNDELKESAAYDKDSTTELIVGAGFCDAGPDS